MDDGMARRTDGPQVPNRINPVLGVDLGELAKMMNVDQPPCDLSVLLDERQSTCSAAASVVQDAPLPRLGIPFVCIDGDPSCGALIER